MSFSLLERRCELDAEMHACEQDEKAVNDSLALERKAMEEGKRRLRRRIQVLDTAKGLLPQAEMQLVDARHQLRSFQCVLLCCFMTWFEDWRILP